VLRDRLLPFLIVLLFITPLSPPANAGPEAAAPSARSSWSGPIQLTNSTNSSWDPSIYVDGSGNIHLAWQDGTDRTSIRYKSFAPTGEVIVNDTVLVDHIDSQPPIYLSSRPLAPRLDYNNGSLVLFWNETENHPSGQTDHDESLRMLRFSPDLKYHRECSLPIFAVDRLYYGNPLYAFDSKDNIHFVYAGNSETNGEPDVWYVKTNSTGAKLFSKFLAKNETEVGVAVDKWDNVHLLWRNETGSLTYSRLDQNGTEQFRTNITGTMEKISTFTIIASNVFQGVDILFNENSEIFLCPIDYNRSYGSPDGPIFWRLGGDERFYFDPQTPLIAKADLRGSTYLFGYGHPGLQPDPNFPYYVINGVFNEYAIWPDPENVSGLNLVDYGYTELGPPFSTFVFTQGVLGGYVAYSSDRLNWEDPAGGINIYLKQLGPYNSDLFVRDIGFSSPSPLQEDNVLINITVGYNGTEQITDFRYYLYLDGVELDHGYCLLGPYNTSTVTFNWTASWGMHNFSAQVISQLFVEPLSNNEKNASLYVAGRPDISVEKIVWDPPSPLVGDPVNITARIVNTGESAAEFRWGIEVNGSIVIMSNTRLGPGERGNFSAQWRPALPGNYTLLALADRTDPYELELGNNSLERTINVSPALISVEILSPADGSHVQGMVNVTGRVNGIWGEPVLRLALGNESPESVPLFPDGAWSLDWNTTKVPNGLYNISAVAANGWVESSASIRVEVRNPVPKAVFRPVGDVIINESDEVVFETEIAWAPPLNASFNWTVNGIGLVGIYTQWAEGAITVNTTRSAGGALSKLRIYTTRSFNGTYNITVSIGYFFFEQVQTSFSWKLIVRNVNTPPEIWEARPVENITVSPTDVRLFQVMAGDAEDPINLTYTWFVDGERCQTVQSSPAFIFRAQGKVGARQLMVVVSDGEFQVSHNWTVTVLPKKETVKSEVIWLPWAAIVVICAVVAIGLWVVYRLRKPPRPA
jgi:hypothetical protein